ALLLFVGLALFGQRYHWVEEAGSAERDGYVRQAGQLLAGEIPRDPYRPLLYPLLTAGLSFLTGDPFVAARLISNLAATALALLAYAFGRRLAGPDRGAVAGGWAFALVAVNPNLWILGQHVSTDMLFAALAAAALLAGLAYLDEPRLSIALAGGLALGLAWFTRSNALFLVPALAVAWWLGGRRKGGHLAAAAAVCALALIPHWILRQAVFGSPFYDENWKNVAWKLYGYPDWSYLDRVPFSGLGEVLRQSPGAFLEGGLRELVRFASSGLSQLLGTALHTVLFLGGAIVALGRRPRAAAWTLGAGALFLVATAFAFFTWGRLLLLLLPLATGLSAQLLVLRGAGGALSRGAGEGRGGHRLWAVAGALLVLILAIKTFAFRLPAFVDRHPYEEVAVLRRLDADLPAGVPLAGTSPFLGRYLHGRRYVDLPDAFGSEVDHPALYYRKLETLLAGSGVRYLVIGQVDLRDRPAALLLQSGTPPFAGLEADPARSSPKVAVWRVLPGLADRPLQRTNPLPTPSSPP
ncbi:MAG TPA: glycosyltransferase family 39 protein, partial [Thermoanaerobaculia bacterium]|nr:glycosyltransferase family 39 protein [Thermoanaerobaculia bacterium]